MVQRKIEAEHQLQNLVTHTILIQKKHYKVSDIANQVCNNELFNNFCDKCKVKEMVSETIIALLRQHFIKTYPFEDRSYVTIT